jgi:hypothetical protein
VPPGNLAEFEASLNAILDAKYPVGSHKKFNQVSDLFDKLYKTNPAAAALLEAALVKGDHSLAIKLKAGFKSSSRSKLFSSLTGRPARFISSRATTTTGTRSETPAVLGEIGRYDQLSNQKRSLASPYADWSRGSTFDHPDSKQVIMETLRNPETGRTPFTEADYKDSQVLTIPRDMDVIKTRMDRRLLKRVKAGTVTAAELQPEADVQRMLRARKMAIRERRRVGRSLEGLSEVSEDRIRLAVHAQLGQKFHAGKRAEKSAGLAEELDREIQDWENRRDLKGPKRDAMEARAKAKMTTSHHRGTKAQPVTPTQAIPDTAAKPRGKGKSVRPPLKPKRAVLSDQFAVKKSDLLARGDPTSRIKRGTEAPKGAGRQVRPNIPKLPKKLGRGRRVAKAAIGEMIETIAAAGLAFLRSRAYQKHKGKKRHAIQSWRAQGHYVRLSAVFEVQNDQKKNPNRLDTSPLVAVSVEHTTDPLEQGWVDGIALPPPTPDRAHKNLGHSSGRGPGKSAYFEMYPVEMLRPTEDLIAPNRLKLNGSYAAVPTKDDQKFGTADLRSASQSCLIHPVTKILADSSRAGFSLKDYSDIVDYQLEIRIEQPKGITVLYYNSFFGHHLAQKNQKNIGPTWSGYEPLELRYSLSDRFGMGIYFLSKLTVHYTKNDQPYLLEERWYGASTEVKLGRPWQFHFQHGSRIPQRVVLWNKRGDL